MNETNAALSLTASALEVLGPERTIVAPQNLEVRAGEMLAIIGESGSGKSMTAKALTGLLPRGVRARGEASVAGYKYDMSTTDSKVWANVRGNKIVLLMQDPFTSLSPVIRCGEQIAATIKARPGASKIKNINEEVLSRLAEVNLPATVAKQYPTELSGGMRQRVAIAAALAAEPALLIADEPTTALDASNQGEVLDLLRSLQKSHNMGLILISHDLGVVSGRADRIIVMQHGVVVESGSASAVIENPKHDYTKALIAANPSLAHEAIETQQAAAQTGKPLLTATNMSKTFGTKLALENANVDVAKGEIVAIVGESGSGKSTFARCIAALETPNSGEVQLAGETLSLKRGERKPNQMQIVFQDPYSTLNPSFKISKTLEEALASATEQRFTVTSLLELVELDPALAGRRPSQLSGGQRQRIAIARALAANPQVLICDESVSALDVSVQAQILELLLRLRDELGLAMLFITHDLGVVARIANRVIVMQNGRVVETGDTKQVLHSPRHEYTRMLVQAALADSFKN